MFRVVTEEGKPEQVYFVPCDNPRCMKTQAMQVGPGVPEVQAITAFFQALGQAGWLVLPYGHHCAAHKHAFMAPVQRSLIVPVAGMPHGARLS